MEDLEGALTIIRGAIQNEIAGQRFYQDAAQYCIDPWAKEAFARLAQEEEKHVTLLLGEHHSLTTQGRWLPPRAALELGAKVDVSQIPFSTGEAVAALFPDGGSARQAIDRGADDLSALAFGLQIEERSIALYQQQADAAVDSSSRETFLSLVDEERRHREQLQARWESLAGRPWPNS
jgi:rubrerythrin